MSFESKLDQVRARLARWGRNLEPPASEGEIDLLRKRTETNLNAILPEQYIGFLRLADGLEFNGLIIYGTKNSVVSKGASPRDLVEMNCIARGANRKELQEFIILGEDGTGLLVFEILTGRFQHRDRIGLDRAEDFISFSKLFEDALTNVL